MDVEMKMRNLALAASGNKILLLHFYNFISVNFISGKEYAFWF